MKKFKFSLRVVIHIRLGRQGTIAGYFPGWSDVDNARMEEMRTCICCPGELSDVISHPAVKNRHCDLMETIHIHALTMAAIDGSCRRNGVSI